MINGGKIFPNIQSLGQDSHSDADEHLSSNFTWKAVGGYVSPMVSVRGGS